MKRIPLTRGLFARVDDDDYDWLSQFNWHVVGPNASNGRFYAVRYSHSADGKHVLVKMEQEVLSKRPGWVIDHANLDTLDNRKRNLRWATDSQNMANRILPTGVSGYRGVYRNGAKWCARIGAGPRRRYLGNFASAREAAQAYNAAAVEMFGQFARLNSIEEETC